MPPMIAAMKIRIPGVLIQLNEVVEAVAEVLIWNEDEKVARKVLTGATSLEVNSSSTKIRINGRKATPGDMLSFAAEDGPDCME